MLVLIIFDLWTADVILCVADYMPYLADHDDYVAVFRLCVVDQYLCLANQGCCLVVAGLQLNDQILGLTTWNKWLVDEMLLEAADHGVFAAIISGCVMGHNDCLADGNFWFIFWLYWLADIVLKDVKLVLYNNDLDWRLIIWGLWSADMYFWMRIQLRKTAGFIFKATGLIIGVVNYVDWIICWFTIQILLISL